MQTYIGAIHVLVNPGKSNEFSISRESQLDEAKLTIRDIFVEHMSENSSVPYDKSFVGLEATLTLSLSEMSFNLFKNLTNPAYIQPKKLQYGDLTALKTLKSKVLIRPYEGFLPTLNTDDWFTFLNASIEVDSNLTFGKSTQTSFEIKITAYNSTETGIKFVRGYLEDLEENVNNPPTASLIVKSNTPTIDGQTITLQAIVNDIDGFIDRVEFYNNSNKIGEALSVIGQKSPQLSLSLIVETGTYNFTCIAIDNKGAGGISNIVTLTVEPKKQILYNLIGVGTFE